jgi:hypothetical protein
MANNELPRTFWLCQNAAELEHYKYLQHRYKINPKQKTVIAHK